jgi:hypothetical protein
MPDIGQMAQRAFAATRGAIQNPMWGPWAQKPARAQKAVGPRTVRAKGRRRKY